MKRNLFFATLLFSFLVLASCATTHNRSPYANNDLAQENWMQQMHPVPKQWAKGADTWFYSGEPNAVEVANRQAPANAVMSTMNVNVPDFNDIKVEGDYQVQIFGTNGPNTVAVYGPNEDVRRVVVNVNGNQLCLRQVKGPQCAMGRVIVRIGINHLRRLSHTGCGTVEVSQVNSDHLELNQLGGGAMYLSGHYNVNRIINNGGIVSLWGANTPYLDIATAGDGATNVSGSFIGLHSIKHHGNNDVTVLGSRSQGLFVGADGSGKIVIGGQSNVQEIKTKGTVGVYITGVNSPVLYVYANGASKIGLTGNVTNFYAQANGAGLVMAKFLCVREGFVRATGDAHVNLSASHKLFASSTQNSSVYFFGSPGIMNQFVAGNGMVMPIWVRGVPYCAADGLRGEG